MVSVALPMPVLSDLTNTTYHRVLSSGSSTVPVRTKGSPLPRYTRCMGDSETSYYLPSRASGVNDMYLHLGFHATSELVQRARVRAVWAILRGRHPLLTSRVEMHDYDHISFVHDPPSSPEDALMIADENLEYRSATKDDLLNSYLNGPRTLSDERLSYLILSQSDSTQPNYDILICAAHFLGDGMALHQFANDFFSLLSSSSTVDDLEIQVGDEWRERWTNTVSKAAALPNALEDNFPAEGSKFRRVVAEQDFKASQAKLIGGHTFPRRSSSKVHTVVPTVSFNAQRTKAILKHCKSRGVSISAALFGICNIGWAQTVTNKPEMPMMMYSALNLRPYFKIRPANDSYWFLAVGYFNVILPTFLPSSDDLSSTFWHRTKSAKEQSTRAVTNPMAVSRSRLMAQERGRRSRIWAKEDDDKERGTYVPPPVVEEPTSVPAKSPSQALIGLSLLGNLDGVYKHSTFSNFELHTLTTGSRQRQGGMLLFGYTFAGKLWISLGYDENGFEEGVVPRFWSNCLKAIDEYL